MVVRKSFAGLAAVFLCASCSSKEATEAVEVVDSPVYPLQVEVSREAGPPLVCAGFSEILFPNGDGALVLDPVTGSSRQLLGIEGGRVVPFCDPEKGPRPLFVDLRQLQVENRLEVLRESPLEVGLSCVHNV